jgi:mono/diheme cytochrome c family protein
MEMHVKTRCVSAVVAFALICAGGIVSSLSAAVRPSARADDPPPGQVVYDRVCKVCHGPEGQGNAGPALVPFEMEVDELLAKVREGGGEMPPISANRVSDDEVKQIAAYLTSLSPK